MSAATPFEAAAGGEFGSSPGLSAGGSPVGRAHSDTHPQWPQYQAAMEDEEALQAAIQRCAQRHACEADSAFNRCC